MLDISPTLIKAAIAVAGGAVLGYFFRQLIAHQRKEEFELKAKKILLDAKELSQKTIEDAKIEAEKILKETKEELKEKEKNLQKTEERLASKDELLEKRVFDLNKDEGRLKENQEKLKNKETELEELKNQEKERLEKIAGLSSEEAKKQLIESLEKKSESDLLARMQKLELFANEALERKAKDILATTIQRMASATTSEVSTTSVTIPSDDIKGKIIGKEGRNIRALERAAGVEVLVDDTPGMIMISSFDPVRRQIAKIALENLIQDGRIQPAKIEEMVEKAKLEIEKMKKEAGEKAAYEVGMLDIDPRLLMLLGRLKFRTSYGQNVLH